MSPSYIYKVKVIRVIDGDTIEVDVDVGFRWTGRFPVRLARINAPEMRGPTAEAGGAAKDHLSGLLVIAPDKILIQTYKPRATDKYGRWLGEVSADGVDVNQKMIDDGFAVPYLLKSGKIATRIPGEGWDVSSPESD